VTRPPGFQRLHGTRPNDFPTARPTDVGLVGWTADPANDIIGAAALATAGTLYLSRVKTLASLVTAIQVNLTVAGGTLTAGRCFAALFTDAGTLLSSTADQATAWTSTGVKDMALSVAQAVVPNSWYQVGLFFNGTTGPTLSIGANVSAALTNAGLAAAPYRYSTANTGLTTSMPGTFSAQTATATAWWIALR
jgi:hypothetical protein